MTTSIPLYAYDGTLIEHAVERRIARLESLGLVRVVRHRKGHVNRAIFRRRPGEPEPPKPGAYLGTRYSFMERLDDGRRCWQLKRLAQHHQPSLLQVVADCLVR